MEKAKFLLVMEKAMSKNGEICVVKEKAIFSYFWKCEVMVVAIFLAFSIF